MTSTAADIARLTAELTDLQKRYSSATTKERRIVLVARMVEIKHKLIGMGAARERVANITLKQRDGQVVTVNIPLFDNPYDLDQMRLDKEVKRATRGARVLRWGWAD